MTESAFPPFVRDAGEADIPAIRALADRTWRACYPGIISHEQIDYMLARMYAPEKIAAEMLRHEAVYLLVSPANSPGGEPAGFAAFGPGEEPGAVLLHKLYIDPAHQRRGLGRHLLAEIETLARARAAERIVLRVNRHNRHAIAAYLRAGFRVDRDDRADIGGGFAMDDHIMIKAIGG